MPSEMSRTMRLLCVFKLTQLVHQSVARAAHDDELLEVGEELRVQPARHGQVRERCERHERDSAGVLARQRHERLRRVLALTLERAVGGKRVAFRRAAQAVLAVDAGRVHR